MDQVMLGEESPSQEASGDWSSPRNKSHSFFIAHVGEYQRGLPTALWAGAQVSYLALVEQVTPESLRFRAI
jgi:hypothetical protein